MTVRHDPDGLRLPIKIDTTTNGEFMPRPLSAAARRARLGAREAATALARRLGLSRRSFLTSSAGAAATLLAINEAFAAEGATGGRYAVPPEAALDADVAQSVLGGREFIFDVQGHHVNPAGAWRRPLARWSLFLRSFPQARCGEAEDAIGCFSAERFLQEVFLDSDTDLCVLSMVPAAPGDNPLSLEDAAATRALVEKMEGDHRLMIHGLVHPQLDGAIEAMAAQVETYKVAAFKTYTQWGPSREKGYWLHDETYGIPMIEKARALGVPTICVHKGLPLPGILHDTDYARPIDVGVVARLFPDVTFIVYHSGYDPDRPEGPYNPVGTLSGVDELIRSLEDNGIPPNGNVYAELGSTWRHVMRSPEEAAHLLGKLMRHVGEDRVLWGTDSIWYGSPQDQIQAFRTFTISEAFQERHGYPALTPERRAKIFGLNAARGPYRLDPAEIEKRAARDATTRLQAAYREAPDPSFLTYGPRTRREFLSLMKLTGGRPA